MEPWKDNTYSLGVLGGDEREENEDNQTNDRDEMSGHVPGQEVECNSHSGTQKQSRSAYKKKGKKKLNESLAL